MVPFVYGAVRYTWQSTEWLAHANTAPRGVKLRNVEMTWQHILQGALWHDGDGYAPQQHPGVAPDSEPQMPDAALHRRPVYAIIGDQRQCRQAHDPIHPVHPDI